MWRVDGALREALSEAADQQRSRCICLGALTYSDKRGHDRGQAGLPLCELITVTALRAQAERQPVNNLQIIKERAVKDIHYL